MQHTISHDTADTARRLRGDHRDFEARFEDLRNRAAAATWHELDEVWGPFVRDVEDHFRFEESQVFPDYARQDTEARALTDALTAEHAEIRRTLEILGIEIQLHQIRATTIEALVALMQKHAALENEHIYPWLERALSSRQPPLRSVG